MNEVTGMTKDKESQHAQAQEEKHFQKSTRRVLCGLLLCAVLVLFLLGSSTGHCQTITSLRFPSKIIFTIP